MFPCWNFDCDGRKVMTVEELVKARKELEQDIRIRVERFNADTGMGIKSMCVGIEEEGGIGGGGRNYYVSGVEITLDI